MSQHYNLLKCMQNQEKYNIENQCKIEIIKENIQYFPETVTMDFSFDVRPKIALTSTDNRGDNTDAQRLIKQSRCSPNYYWSSFVNCKCVIL